MPVRTLLRGFNLFKKQREFRAALSRAIARAVARIQADRRARGGRRGADRFAGVLPVLVSTADSPINTAIVGWLAFSTSYQELLSVVAAEVMDPPTLTEPSGTRPPAYTSVRGQAEVRQLLAKGDLARLNLQPLIIAWAGVRAVYDTLDVDQQLIYRALVVRRLVTAMAALDRTQRGRAQSAMNRLVAEARSATPIATGASAAGWSGGRTAFGEFGWSVPFSFGTELALYNSQVAPYYLEYGTSRTFQSGTYNDMVFAFQYALENQSLDEKGSAAHVIALRAAFEASRVIT